MNACWQLYLANFKEFVRDRMSLFWTIAFPLFFIVLFGLIFSGDDGPSYDLGLVDEDQGMVGAEIGQRLEAVEIFEVETGAREALLATLLEGELDLVVVVPAGTSDAVTAGQPTALEAHYDPTNQAIGQLVLGVLNRMVAGIDQGLT